jgi:hypothetical protein
MNVNFKYLWLTIALSALIPTMSVSVPALASSQDTLSITGNGDTAAMALKFDGGQDTRPVRGFVLTADNVLQIQEGQTVRITNDVDFSKARTTDVNNNDKDIRISDNGEISFSGYPEGVYVLDVVSGDKAYECIIVIGEQSQDVINKEINRINIKTKIIIDIDIPDDCSNAQGSAGLSFPFDKKSECELEEYQQCEIDELIGLPETDRCNDLDEGFNDDCFGFTNSEECNAYWTDPDKFCQQNPEHAKCPIIYVSEGPCDGYIDTTTQECIPVTATPEPLITPTPEPTPEPTPNALALSPTPEPTPPITPTPEPTPTPKLTGNTIQNEEPTLFGGSTSTPTPVPTPNVLARGLLPTTPSPTLDNPCEAIPEPDIPECKDLPAETLFPTEEIEEIPSVPLEDTEEEEVEEEEPEEEEPEEPEEEEPEEESGGDDEASFD